MSNGIPEPTQHRKRFSWQRAVGALIVLTGIALGLFMLTYRPHRDLLAASLKGPNGFLRGSSISWLSPHEYLALDPTYLNPKRWGRMDIRTGAFRFDPILSRIYAEMKGVSFSASTSPDWQTAVISSDATQIALLDLKTNRYQWVQSQGQGGLHDAAWRPDGKSWVEMVSRGTMRDLTRVVIHDLASPKNSTAISLKDRPTVNAYVERVVTQDALYFIEQSPPKAAKSLHLSQTILQVPLHNMAGATRITSLPPTKADSIWPRLGPNARRVAWAIGNYLPKEDLFSRALAWIGIRPTSSTESLWTSNLDGTDGICLGELRHTAPTTLSQIAANRITYPTWQPDGKGISFEYDGNVYLLRDSSVR